MRYQYSFDKANLLKINTTQALLFLLFLILSCSFNTVSASESIDAVNAGAKEFQQRCALCHGDNGKGNGPYAFALVFKPSDLTTLLADNNGVFPFLETYLIIDGREIVKSHGPRLMPIWGNRYSTESWSEVDPEYGDTLVRGRILELILFLFSIQEPITSNN
ncbi:MAG: cytochrome c [Gammaproteobacteria bacterium]|nr:MAG: cytochrome c [Gammaproteobacteria bacterium]